MQLLLWARLFLGVMVVMLIVSVIMRKAFNGADEGCIEMTEFGMVMITFLCMSAQYLSPMPW